MRITSVTDNEEVFEFPCRFPVKVMGRDEPKFQAHVVKMISSHVAGISAEDVVTRPSSKGKFVSVTVTFTAENRQQLDDVYRTLTSDEQVLYVL